MSQPPRKPVLLKNRRFVRDYEQLTAVAETLIIIAAIATLIRR